MRIHRQVVWILVLAVILGGFGASAAQSQYSVSESFDSYATNSAPTAKGFSGADARVVETEPGKNKAFYAKATINDEVSLSYDATSASGTYVIMADIRMVGGRALGDISLQGATNLTLLEFDEKGHAKADGGKRVGGLGTNVRNHVAIAVNTSQNRYSVYLDRKKVLSNWYVADKIPSITGFSINFFVDEEAESEIYIDNVYMYEGTQVYKDSQLPKGVYNTESMEYVPQSQEETSQNRTVILNSDFDTNGTSGLLVVPKGNTIEVEEEGGNKYLSFVQSMSDDLYVDAMFTEAGKNIVAEMDIYLETSANMAIFTSKDSANGVNSLMSLSGGSLGNVGGGGIGSIPLKKWTKIAAVLNFSRHTYDVYINGELAGEDLLMQNQAIGAPTMFRVQLLPSESENTVRIDNFKIYTGRTLMEDGEEATTAQSSGSVLPGDAFSTSRLEGSVAFNTYGKTVFLNGEKSETLTPAYRDEAGVPMVPLQLVCDAFEVEFQVEGGVATVNGKQLAATDVGGTAYVPGQELADALGKGYTWHERGLVVIGATIANEELFNGIGILDEITNYMMYDRPSAAELISAFEQKSAGQHPRVQAEKEAFVQVRQGYVQGGRMKEWIDARFIPQVEALINSNWMPTHTLPDGLRFSDAQNTLNNIELLALSYIATEDKRYADYIWKIVEEFCSFPDWNAGRHFLDVSAAACAVALAYDWLYDVWTPSQRVVMEEAILEKGLLELEKVYDGMPSVWSGSVNPSWAQMTMNWNAVCNGCMAQTVMALMDEYPQVCATLLSKMLYSLEYQMLGFFPDGGYREGPAGYWGYLTQNLQPALASLDSVFGDDFGLADAPGFSDTWKFPVAMTNNQGISNNYSDSGSTPILYNGNMCYYFWFAKKYNLPQLGALRLQMMDDGVDIYGASFPDLLYYDPVFETTPVEDLPLDMSFLGEDVQGVAMRENYTDMEGAYVAYHAVGELGQDHGHLDAGTYVLDMAGFRVAVDLGADDYNLPGFFDYPGARNHFYRVRPEGHNLFVINPDSEFFGQQYGELSRGKVETLVSKPRGAISVVDLSVPYAPKADKVRRGFLMGDDRRSVTVRDEITLKEAESEVYWMVHTEGSIEIVDKNTAIITSAAGQKVQLQFLTNADSWELKDMDAQPLPQSPVVEGQNANEGIRRLTAILQTKQKDLYMAVRYTPLNSSISKLPLENIQIDDWTIPDGEVIPMPQLDSIAIDGEAIPDFNPTLSSYTIKRQYGAPEPEITAVAEGKTVEVVNQENGAQITVYSDQDPNLYRTYTISFAYTDFAQDPIMNAEEITAFTRYTIANVEASAVPEPANGPANAIDGDQSTRWAGSGDPVWIQFDLGQEKTVSAVGVATMLSDQRATIFDVEVSTDGNEWIQAYSGATSGTQTGVEYFRINDLNARYVRLIGHGNTSENSSVWTSITEFEIYGK